MIKRLFLFTLIIFLSYHCSYTEELIPDFEKDSIPIVNEELRLLQDEKITKPITAGTAGQFLQTQGSGTNPQWANAFTDRGDASAWDFDQDDLTEDATWRDLDLSSIVPAGAKTVLLLVIVKDDAVGSVFYIRENGNSNEYNKSGIKTMVVNESNMQDFIVACDSDRKVEYYATNTTWTAIAIAVKGWWK